MTEQALPAPRIPIPDTLVTIVCSYLSEWRRYCDGEITPLVIAIPANCDQRISTLARDLEKDMAEGFKAAPVIVALLEQARKPAH